MMARNCNNFHHAKYARARARTHTHVDGYITYSVSHLTLNVRFRLKKRNFTFEIKKYQLYQSVRFETTRLFSKTFSLLIKFYRSNF